MNIVAFLLVGLISGWIASLIVEGHGFGAIGDIIIGVIGAFVGGFVFDMLGVASYGFWGAVGMSLVGAVVFLFVVNLFGRFFGSHNRPVRKT